jgi:hypothetical protein
MPVAHGDQANIQKDLFSTILTMVLLGACGQMQSFSPIKFTKNEPIRMLVQYLHATVYKF